MLDDGDTGSGKEANGASEELCSPWPRFFARRLLLYYVNDIKMTDRTMQHSSTELGYLLAACQQQ